MRAATLKHLNKVERGIQRLERYIDAGRVEWHIDSRPHHSRGAVFDAASFYIFYIFYIYLDVDALWSVQTIGPYDTKQCLLRAEP